MKTADFDYNLPEELIAQEPAAQRDECRLLVMNRQTGEVEDRIFRDIKEYLRPGDLIIANETRVLPARLLGTKRGTGGAAEVFLLKDVTLENAGAGAASAAGATAGATAGGAAGANSETAGAAPANATTSNASAYWEVLVKPGRRLKAGAVVDSAMKTALLFFPPKLLTSFSTKEKTTKASA